MGDTESTWKDDFKLLCVFHNAHSAYKNLWPVGMKVLKLRLISWENDATVQTNNIVLLENNTIRITCDDCFSCYLLCFKPVSKDENTVKVLYSCCLTHSEFSAKYLDNVLCVNLNDLSVAGRV